MSLNDAGHTRLSWRILALLTLVHVLTSTGMFGFQVLLPQIKKAFDLNHATIGGLMASFFLGISVLSPVSGLLVDRFGVRRSIIFGSLLVGGSFVAASGLSRPLFMAPLLVIAGTGHSVLTPSSNKAVMTWFETRNRATAMGIKQTGINGGGLLASMLVPFVAAAAGWRPALVTAGLVAGSAALTTLLFYKGSYGGLPGAQRLSAWRSQIGRVLGSRDIPLLAMEGFFRVGVQMGLFTYLLLYLEREIHMTLAAAGLMYATVQLGGAGGRVVLGMLSDRMFGGRRKPVYSICGAVAAVGFFVLSQYRPSTPPLLVFITMLLLGISAAGHQGVGLALVSESAGSEFTGIASGVCQSLFFLGVVVISPLVGYVIDMTGSFAYAWVLLALMSLCCCAILHFVRERPGYPRKEVMLADRQT